jgi:LysR family glycine cleavage system transcriptional activator
LRAFETAARHLSFVKAADELHVTPAAISHQVKGLEDFLGLKLFRRLHRGLLLTDAGQRFLPELREGFVKLDSAVERTREIDDRGPLMISVAPASPPSGWFHAYNNSAPPNPRSICVFRLVWR